MIKFVVSHQLTLYISEHVKKSVSVNFSACIWYAAILNDSLLISKNGSLRKTYCSDARPSVSLAAADIVSTSQ